MNGHKIVNQGELHFVTFTVVGWTDVFTRDIYCNIIIEALNHCVENKGLQVHAYVIMSSHIHLILSDPENLNLSGIIRDFKTHTAKSILNSIKESNTESRKEWMMKLFKYFAKYNKRNGQFQFWKQDNKPIELVSTKWTMQKLSYIHLNPVRAGIVLKAEEYVNSSAKEYVEESYCGPIKLNKLELPGSLVGLSRY